MLRRLLLLLLPVCFVVSPAAAASAPPVLLSPSAHVYDHAIYVYDDAHSPAQDASRTSLVAVPSRVAIAGSQRAVSALAGDPGAGVAANKGPSTLFHYTDEAGQRGILESGRLNPSLKSVSPKDARYGDGQYLSDIVPGTKTCAQLARCFLGRPFPAQKYTHYVEIDVSDLPIIKGRDGVFLNPSGESLDITSRLISAGMN